MMGIASAGALGAAADKALHPSYGIFRHDKMTPSGAAAGLGTRTQRPSMGGNT
jgi:hypothetical protein